MKPKCLAKGCMSNGKTEIDGGKIEFYTFPVDKTYVCKSRVNKKLLFVFLISTCISIRHINFI